MQEARSLQQGSKGTFSQLSALVILFRYVVSRTSAWLVARGGIWLEDGVGSWVFGNSPIHGGRRAENVGSRRPASGHKWEFGHGYPECSCTDCGAIWLCDPHRRTQGGVVRERDKACDNRPHEFHDADSEPAPGM